MLSFLAAKVKSTDDASHGLRHCFKKDAILTWVVQVVRDKDLHQNCEMDFRHCGDEVGSGGRRFLLRRSWLHHREDSVKCRRSGCRSGSGGSLLE